MPDDRTPPDYYGMALRDAVARGDREPEIIAALTAQVAEGIENSLRDAAAMRFDYSRFAALFQAASGGTRRC